MTTEVGPRRKVSPTGLEKRLDRSLQVLTDSLSARLIESHEGTPLEKEALVNNVSAMRRALQLAVAEGGRVAYEAELARWKAHEFYEEFVRCVDGHMTTMPWPREEVTSNKE